MRIVLLTPGTGSYYCGVCMRDNALAKELVRQGHEALMVPMYLPLTLDEDAASAGPVFFGGINVYLQQKFAFFRHTPKWVDALFNQRWMLRLAGRQSGMTGGAEIGELTYSMLQGEEGRQAKELEKLVEWLRELGPDAVWLSTGLLAGVVGRIKAALDVPVLCSLQGEDSFLDGLAAPWSAKCWDLMSEKLRQVERIVAPSQWYAGMMSERLRLPAHQLKVIPNGIAAHEFGAPSQSPAAPVIGYLARLNASKGLGLVVDAFIHLRHSGKMPGARLRCAGTMTAGDQEFLDEIKVRLARARLLECVEFLPDVSRDEKIEFLRSLSVLSVPAIISEAFGLYLVEAFATGVPVVQPRSWAYPEILEASGAGILCEPGSPSALAEAWIEMLSDPAKIAAYRTNARAAAESHFSLETMAQAFLKETREMIDGHKRLG